MAENNYKATWVSHSSMGDFLKCPRLYQLRHDYKDPVSRNKITIITPPLALGQMVHEVLEDLSSLPVEQRLKDDLIEKFNNLWEETVKGEKGGFSNKAQEDEYKERGIEMLKTVIDNPGPIKQRAVKIKSPDQLPPRYTISEEDNIILCGKIDWLNYREDDDTVHIIDFKTSKREESEDSLQLPIYYLLARNLQSRDINGASYWYLGLNDKPAEVELDDYDEIEENVLKQAKRVKLARQLEHYKCPRGGCMHCTPYEEILAGKGKLVNVSDYQDIYALL